MKLTNSLIIPLLAFFPAYSLTSQAASITDPESSLKESYLSLQVQLGWSRVLLGDSVMGFTAFESNDQVITNDTDAFAQSAGIGYAIPLLRKKGYGIQWLTEFKPSLDYYHFLATEHGDLYQFDINNFAQSLHINNNRLMFDGTLTIMELGPWSILGLAGIGPSWTQLRYSQDPKFGETGDLELDTETNFKWVGQFGGGVAWEYNPAIDISFMYLYTDYGDIKTSSNVKQTDSEPIDGFIIKPGSYALQTHSLFLGIEWNFR